MWCLIIIFIIRCKKGNKFVILKHTINKITLKICNNLWLLSKKIKKLISGTENEWMKSIPKLILTLCKIINKKTNFYIFINISIFF